MSDFFPVKAVRAARRIAEDLGLGAVEPRILSVSEHVSLHLSPAPVVARVKRGADSAAAMRRELAAVRHLKEGGAPVLAPLAEAGPHGDGDCALTLWPFVPHRPADGETPHHQRLAAESLRQVHRAFAGYAGELPDFGGKIEGCRALLLAAPPALAEQDRRFLLAVHDEIAAALRDPALERVPIHGDAGFHNLFLTDGGPLWTDFESACLGPREWDFAALGHDGDPPMSAARSFCVSVWCWDKADLPGKREAAEYHLDSLRGRFR
jgi:Ser/Thr protein kinase RdoA (MazF antagonist)